MPLTLTAAFTPSSSRTRLVRAAAFLAALGAALVAWAPTVSAGDDCDSAKKAFDQAQAALSKATRDADVLANAYADCMQKGGSCTAQQAKHDAALAARAKAAAAVKAAGSRRQNVCH